MRRTALAASAAALLLLSGCSAAHSSTPAPTGAPATALIGLWRVTGADVSKPTWVRFGPNELTVDGGGRSYLGDWDAAEGRITASNLGAGPGPDGVLDDPFTPWLTGARSFTVAGGTPTLRSATGAVLAVLAPEPDPAPSVQAVLGLDATESPDAAFSRAPAVPPQAPPDPKALVGRWVTGTTRPHHVQPFLQLAAGGTYTTSDGCNGTDGTWQLLPDGRLLRTTGINGLVGCDGLVPVDGWMAEARSVRVDGDRLTLYDAQAHPVGTLMRG